MIRILHRDERCVAVDKPSGVATHRGWADDDDALLQLVEVVALLLVDGREPQGGDGDAARAGQRQPGGAAADVGLALGGVQLPDLQALRLALDGVLLRPPERRRGAGRTIDGPVFPDDRP